MALCWDCNVSQADHSCPPKIWWSSIWWNWKTYLVKFHLIKLKNITFHIKANELGTPFKNHNVSGTPFENHKVQQQCGISRQREKTKDRSIIRQRKPDAQNKQKIRTANTLWPGVCRCIIMHAISLTRNPSNPVCRSQRVHLTKAKSLISPLCCTMHCSL